jgi:hypothetical protein
MNPIYNIVNTVSKTMDQMNGQMKGGFISMSQSHAHSHKRKRTNKRHEPNKRRRTNKRR